MADELAIGRQTQRQEALVDLAMVLAAFALIVALPSVGTGPLSYLLAPLKILCLVLLATLRLQRRGVTWRDVGLARPASIGGVALRVVLGYLGLAAVGTMLNLLVLPRLGFAPGSSVAAFSSLEGDTWKYLYWLAIAWTTAAVGEELLFRGFVQSRLEILFGGTRAAVAGALLVQALIFGFGHGYQGVAGVAVTSAAGLVLGAVRLAGRGNLVACIVLHGLVDTISLTAVYLGALSALQAAAAGGG